MTYGYMRNYEDRVPAGDQHSRQQGAMRALARRHGAQYPGRIGSGRFREHEEGGPGRRTGTERGGQRQMGGPLEDGAYHPPGWQKAGQANQAGRSFPPLSYTDADAGGLVLLEPAPRTIRGARDLISVAVQYGNAFETGIPGRLPSSLRISSATTTFSTSWKTWRPRDPAQHPLGMAPQDGPAPGAGCGNRRKRRRSVYRRDVLAALSEEYAKLQRARNVDVHDDSKITTLRSREWWWMHT